MMAYPENIIFVFGILCVFIAALLVLGLHFFLYKVHKKWALRLSASLLSLIAVWALFEIIVVILPNSDIQNNPWFIWTNTSEASQHNNLAFRRLPNINWYGTVHGDLALINGDLDPYSEKIQFRTNADGFRQDSVIENPDVIFIGDSYTEGAQVAARSVYTSQFSQLTGNSVLNFGVSGYSTPEEVIVLKENGLRTKPATVILQVSESNDIHECHRYYKWVKAGKPKDRKSTEVLPTVPAWKNYSLIFHFYNYLFGPVLKPYQLQGGYRLNNGKSELVRFLQLPESSMSVGDRIGWNVMQGSLLRFSELCRKNNVKLLVLLIPDKINVLSNYINFDAETNTLVKKARDEYEHAPLTIYLDSLCSNLNVQFLDARPALEKAAANGELVYKPFDTHLSISGHRVIADTLAYTVANMNAN